MKTEEDEREKVNELSPLFIRLKIHIYTLHNSCGERESV
jgi:hypothetical protein